MLELTGVDSSPSEGCHCDPTVDTWSFPDMCFGHVPMTFAFFIIVVEVGFLLICHYYKFNSPLKCTGILLRRYMQVNGQRKLERI